MHWYYSVAGEARGPVSQEELTGLCRSLETGGGTLIWNPELTEWKPALVLLPDLLIQDQHIIKPATPLPASPVAEKANPFATGLLTAAEETTKPKGFFARWFGKKK
jgi:hypothetical protein